MTKKIAALLGTALFLIPALAAAETVQNDKLISLYSQLVQLLQTQLDLLKSLPQPTLDISPTTGKAPLEVVFTLLNGRGTEAIDYGDGYTSGINGCARNALGWCDLSLSKIHTYALPVTYTATLYMHPTPSTLKALGTTKITVTP